jgi:hypothetical protein
VTHQASPAFDCALPLGSVSTSSSQPSARHRRRTIGRTGMVATRVPLPTLGVGQGALSVSMSATSESRTSRSMTMGYPNMGTFTSGCQFLFGHAGDLLINSEQHDRGCPVNFTCRRMDMAAARNRSRARWQVRERQFENRRIREGRDEQTAKPNHTAAFHSRPSQGSLTW